MILARWIQAGAASAMLLVTSLTLADDAASGAAAAAFVDRVWTITSTVLEKHIEPPTRQEMLLGAARGLMNTYPPDALGEPPLQPPHKLSRQFSEASGEAELRKLLADVWHQAHAARQPGVMDRESAAMLELSRTIPGPTRVVPTKEFAVQQQLSENRYVGIGIQLAAEKDGRPFIVNAFRRAPLYNAGGRDKDRIMAVNGQSTEKLALNQVIDLLRGPEGSSVQVEVRAPDAEESRVLEIVRSVVPLETIQGRRNVDDLWDYRVEEDSVIGYVKFQSIGPSTLLELRAAAQRMQSQKLQSLVLDLREVEGGNVHHAAIIADALLDKCRIGSVQMVDAVRDYESQPDHLFSGWPLAVLVDRSTQNEAEWLAAALQDNGRATIIGEQTPGDAYVVETFPLPGELGAISLRTGILKRTKGVLLNWQPGIVLSRERSPAADRPVFAGGVRPDHNVPRTANLTDAVLSGLVTLSQPIDPYISLAVKVLTEGQASANRTSAE